MAVKSFEEPNTSQNQDAGQEPVPLNGTMAHSADASGAVARSDEDPVEEEGIGAPTFEGEDVAAEASVTGSVDAAGQALILSVQHILALICQS